MEELKIELEKAKNLLILKESEGGKVLIINIKSEIDYSVERLAASYADLTHIQLITELSNLKAKMNLLESIVNSEEKVNILKDELKELDKK